MRSLRKITFVNSAHIRYAEVKIDGNVHFIGTQGVGKSTLLRAILFFYNAHKQHLGIAQEMKSFDEFYLPNANSYIVYEVEHENGPFSVMVFRSSGRACYRFIDAPYQKEWLVDAHGEVTAESKVIRERIPEGVYMSKIIDRYEQYLDIIYGNRQAVGKEFYRFQLMETNRYQNIYRSIQNVFLNSRLDANFIKDIIIRSMSEEEANIDLGYFRRQVSNFDQEYKDISCWYKTNQKGEAVVRKQADNVVKSYNELLYMKKQIEELCGELKYAERISKERLPLVETKISELSSEIERQGRLIDELQQKYDGEKSQLNQELGSVNNNLDRLKVRRDYYATQNIESVLQRYNKENGLKSDLEELKSRLSDLTSRYNDVTDKYKAIAQSITNQLESFRISQQQRILTLKDENHKEEGRLQEEWKKGREDVDLSFEEKIKSANSVIDSLRIEGNDCEKALLELKYSEPFKTEKEALIKQQNDLGLREKELEGLISSLGSEINRLQSEFESKEAEIISKSEHLSEDNQKQINAINIQISGIDQLLDRTKGSLYEWLEENKKDWEHNIGKIINEEKVLYQTGLHPQLADGTSMFGVNLDLTDLPLNVRKPSQLNKEKKELEGKILELKNIGKNINDQRDSDIEQLKKQFAPKIKELRQQKSLYETELQMNPQTRKGIVVKIEDYDTKAKQIIKDRQSEIQLRRQEIDMRRKTAESELEKLNANKQKQLKALEKSYNTSRQKALELLNQKVSEIDTETALREQTSDSEFKKLKQQEVDELKGRGADTKIVEECNSNIRILEEELRFIENHRKLVFGYLRDKEDLFDKEDVFKSQKKTLTEKIQQLKEKYDQRRQQYDQKYASLKREQEERKEDQRVLSEELKKADGFIHDDRLCPSVYADAKERQTIYTPAQAVSELTSIIVSRQSRQNDFKQNINQFKGNFSAKNTFNFRMELSTDEDFLDFAANLDEFLSNNKLEIYRTRVSERYVDILERVSKEMGELTRHESEVEKTINDINHDFKDRNFVGVIKLIALQSVASTDKMVQLMKRIKEFNDENQLSMGELNLFSSSNREDVNQKAVSYLLDFMKSLQEYDQRQYLTLSDLFQLQFRIVENDNDTGWADKLSHVGSEGTDTLVKAMINIMLINVFKEKVSKRFGDFRIHCMMDEIGKLHPQNIKGILDFANARNILLINSSPTTYNVSDYRYTYLLSKDNKSNTVVHPLISQQ